MELWRDYSTGIPAFLWEAAHTPVMLRLRNVGMNCGCEYTSFPLFAECGPYSRWDHSLGVSLIVWEHTRSRAGAMAGLLHDIAAPVFAHVVDFLRGDYLTQEATEEGTESMIRSSPELLRLLADWEIPTEAVCDCRRYPLAESPAPRLCADRLEYTLGNLVNFGLMSRENVLALYRDVTPGRNEAGEEELVFRSRENALRFAEGALRCSEIYVSGEDRYAMQRLSELLAMALKRNVISERMLHSGEDAVIRALLSDAVCAAEWRRFRALHRLISAGERGGEAAWRQIPAKKRCIDPFVSGAGRTSELFETYGENLRSFREKSQSEWLYAE